MHPSYSRLDPLKPEIRLMRLSTDTDGKICVTLRAAVLSPTLPFVAISYVCGDPSITENVLLDGEPLAITVRLAHALRHVTAWRHDVTNSSSPELWADAICINQQDAHEKNHQIQLMAEIFQSADLVLSFLGVDDSLTNLALDTYELIARETSHLSVEERASMHWIQKHASLCDDTWRTDDPEIYCNNEKWHAMSDAFPGLEYWSRVWIFQETALAKQLVICTDSRAIHWSAIEVAWVSLQSLKAHIQEHQIDCPDFLRGTSIWSLLASNFLNWPTFQKIHAARLQASMLTAGSANVREGLMMSLMGRGLRATNRKDHIYGLLSLSRIDVAPDYSETKSVGDVFRDYVSFLLRAYTTCVPQVDLPSLFFLFFAGDGLYSNAGDFPSWGPNYPEESVKSIAGAMPEQVDADAGVFQPDTPIAHVSGLHLVVSGVAVGVMTSTEKAPHEDTWFDGSMLRFFEDIVARSQGSNRDSMPPLQKILRTLRLDSTNNVDESYLFYAFYLIQFLMGMDLDNVDQHLVALGLEPLLSNSDNARFDQCFMDTFALGYSGPSHDWYDGFCNGTLAGRPENDAVISDMTLLRKRWRFFETETGYFGLGPLDARQGDVLTVLHGSGFPVLLRKDGGTIRHVGVCFVVGLMRGEAAGLLKSGEREVEVMRLV